MLLNIIAGLILVGAVGTSCAVWVGSGSFVAGSITFIVGALIANGVKRDKR